MSQNGDQKPSLSTGDVATVATLGGLAAAAVLATGGAALPAYAAVKLASIAAIGLGTGGAYGAARATGLIKDE